MGSLEPYGEKELRVQVRVVETGTSRLAASSRADIKLDDEVRRLYEGRVAWGPGSARPVKDEPGDAVLLGQTGPEGCKWVEARSETPLKGAPAGARAAALALAREKAVRKVLGVKTEPAADFQEGALQERLEDVLRVIRSGRIQDEKIIKDEAVPGSYQVAIQVCVRPARKGADKDFKVELMLNQWRFMEGQEARAIVAPSRNAYVYLYSVDFDQNIIPVFPAPGATDNSVQAGRVRTFPADGERAAGIRLVAELPAKPESSVETLRAIAVKDDATKMLGGAKTYPELVRRLEAAGMDWAEDARVFAIYKAP